MLSILSAYQLGSQLAWLAAGDAGEETDDAPGTGEAASAASSPGDPAPSADLLTLDKAVTECALIQVQHLLTVQPLTMCCWLQQRVLFQQCKTVARLRC